MKRTSVLFVCTGNTCRSPMAEAILKQMFRKEGFAEFQVSSRGVVVPEPRPISDQAREALKAAGIDAGRHESKALSEKDVREADRILVMTSAHREIILRQFPWAAKKTQTLAGTDIEDPLGGSSKDFEMCRIEIQNALLELWPTFQSERTSS